jgi:LysM repeat protein
VRKSSDEVFNTAKDQIYPQIAPRQLVRLGLAYRARPGDTLEGVGTRFGMSIRNLMQLNPDIVAANQNAKMGGKQICVLPSTAQYSECERQVENPDPNHFEATYRVRLAPLKTPLPQLVFM